MHASEKRIREDLESLALCTDGAGPGITRLTFSPAENRARSYLRDQMLQAGLRVRIDEAGNVIGRLDGRDASLPAVMAGSHIDSIRAGGNFDGMAGVVAGLEAARVFRDTGLRPKRSIEIVGFTGEENSRFYPGLFGSRAMAGMLRKEELFTVRDSDGVLLADAMREAGFDPERISAAAYRPGQLHVYLELHIEQCSVLERCGAEVGVVTSISGATHHRVTIRGTADHAGGTPMDMRSDAMCAAAEYTLEAERAAAAAGRDTVATVGSLSVEPNIPNVIPGCVTINADIRSSEYDLCTGVMRALEEKLDAVCARRGCTYSAEREYNSAPVPIPEPLQRVIAESADAAGVTHRRVYSGAGHDAIRIAELCPVAMIFIPSRGGLSHCPEEWTDYSLVAKGAEVLFESLRRFAEQD